MKSFIAALLIGAAAGAQAQTVSSTPKVGEDWRFFATISRWAPATWVTDTMHNRSVTTKLY